MSEQTLKLQGLYTQLEAELPEHLKPHVTFEADESHGCINVVFKDMGEMGKENFKQLRSLLEENYCADFINPAFPQQPYYAIKPKPVVALPSETSIEKAVRDSLIKKAYALNLGIPDTNLYSMPLQKLETLVKVGSKVAPETEPQKTSSDAKPTQEDPKQPSPITLFSATYCGVCEDFGVSCSCQSNSERRNLCLKVLAIKTWQTINVNLEKLCKVAFSQPVVQAASSSHADARSPPAASPPQVQPKPSQQPQLNSGKGTVETWIHALKWEPAKTSTGKDCEKAYELSNLNGNLLKDEYVHLLDELKRRKAANEKNYVAGYLMFHTEQGENPYIGRLKAQGDRR